ncbi:MAG: DUF2147 domain-containing protein [Anderseniella sp.]|jgi:uncharacterized protein (DUF2147 family)|nr:DUF2147 domain-containing protein [Anderseniella sp.]
MKSVFALLSFLALAAWPGLAGNAAASTLIERAQGVWADEEGKSNIEISPCGQYLCGHIVWLREPFDEAGNPKTDTNNPDASQRMRPIIGLTIMKGLEPNSDGDLLKGLVYNAQNGKVYDVYLDPKGATMEVEGCFAKFLCGSQTWTRIR